MSAPKFLYNSKYETIKAGDKIRGADSETGEKAEVEILGLYPEFGQVLLKHNGARYTAADSQISCRFMTEAEMLDLRKLVKQTAAEIMASQQWSGDSPVMN